MRGIYEDEDMTRRTETHFSIYSTAFRVLVVPVLGLAISSTLVHEAFPDCPVAGEENDICAVIPSADSSNASSAGKGARKEKPASRDLSAVKTSLQEDVFGDDILNADTAEKKANLARSLIDDYAKRESDHIRVYALADIARELWIQALRVQGALEAVEFLSDRFLVKRLNLELETLEQILKQLKRRPARKTTARRLSSAALVVGASDLVRRAIDSDEYETAKRALAVARGAANKQDKRLDDLKATLKEEEGVYRRLLEARDKQHAKPDDASLCRKLGEILCFGRNQWDDGLQFLVKGGGTPISDVARLDSSSPEDSRDQASLGERWSKLAQRKQWNDREKRKILARAARWYKAALKKTKSPVDRKRIQQALDDLDRATPRAKGRHRVGDTWQNSLGVTFIWCPENSDKRQSETTPSNGFWLGKHEVTQREWVAVVGTRPWVKKDRVKTGDNYPATWVDWESAVEFCNKLTEIDRRQQRLPKGWRYNLPTESEWELACRAETKTRYSFGDDTSVIGAHAWYRANATSVGEDYPHAVGLKRANAWGFHDMHGNVWELCDGKDGSYVFHRGGCFSSEPRNLVIEFRGRWSVSDESHAVGFRVALVKGR